MNDAILNTINAGLAKAFATKPSKTVKQIEGEVAVTMDSLSKRLIDEIINLKTIKQIEAEMVEIMGQWDGDNAGRLEDRAMIAEDVLNALKNVKELLAELDGEIEPSEDDFIIPGFEETNKLLKKLTIR